MASDSRRTNLPPLALHVPEPKFRPGDAVDFVGVDVPAVDAARRPDTAAQASEFTELSYGLVRVLDFDGTAGGAWDPKLSPDMMRRMLRSMALVRAFDERMFRAQRQGKTSFYMKCTGEEAVAVAAAYALDYEDMCFPSYRQQGLLIARGWSLVDMMNQIYSNSADRLQGKQLPIMYSVKEAGFFSISGNLATQYPQAVGRQQPVGDLQLLRVCRRGGDDLRRACGWLRHRGAQDRRQRRARSLRRNALGGGARADQPGSDADRALHLPGRGPFYLGRSWPVSLGRRADRVAARRPDRAAEGASHRAR